VRDKAVRRNDVIDQSLNVGKPEAPLDAQLAGIGRDRFSTAPSWRYDLPSTSLNFTL
jgi:hypothetical protein